MPNVIWLTGSVQSVPFSGNGVNTLPNNALIGSSGIDTGSSNKYLLAEIEGVFGFPNAPTANTGMSIWFLRTLDGSVWESGSNLYTPARMPDAVIPLNNVAGFQRTVVVGLIPPGNFTVLVKNDGTGQPTSGNFNDVRIRPLTYQF